MSKKFVLVLFFISALTIPPFIGDGSFSLWQPGNELSRYILFQVRFARIFFAFAAGAGLALTGAVFQALLKNDLATPYTLGVSSGGALGAVLAVKPVWKFSYLDFQPLPCFLWRVVC